MRLRGGLEERGALNGHVDTSALFSEGQVFAMQLAVCLCAGISLASGLLVIYWFCLMKKVFRHR